ncbi:hypothetical protein [Flavobacterium lindanitolerans]|uniref:Uncharacterized protein n=1 Tax=Flavobacterium lindanitolerans TaxID=428988 RepID=A0A497V5J6_9FLAO|nr:hypothetical protein [Flavobacterium lindanitolerans]MBC8643604.1 hypothetical protein [Flavobacterium lindanitolerans]PKW28670.1 hypothetical protein B0G92_0294 [Flavobacterium lindanitolerans]RLJ35825.1 hypothetical protein CLV50_1210 [Flavobacterium lindanitolerans]
MKKLVLTSLTCLSLTLFSFTKSTEAGVQRIGRDLYDVTRDTRFSSEDQTVINRTLQTKYNISDVELKRAMANGGMALQAQAGKAILNETWLNIALVHKNFVVWDNARLSDAEMAEFTSLSRRIAAYAGN